ncbi:flavin-containing monooxygenase 5-like isoform X2 [Acanthopagrus latus]|uniref:flavin-containing monooxygenase 5-like isoform X2 n=1 Tax=Acanthopagrus latus TaxID=8177 RepID=UPI00187C0669|nr:flavin-containing monooxygenase 5-like isoform X2 [Acanthopagrus latus]
MTRRVAIVGGGSSGLACIKCCLDEGLEPVCFESSDDIGGLWRFKENPEPDRASIYHSVIINSSKEMMCFSDFPIPAHFPNYMHNSLIMDYFRMYADHFQLIKYIRLNTKVLQLKQRSDFSHSGQWDVETENKDGKKEKHIFDAVMICIGHHCHPNMPLQDFPGIDTFKGEYFHSRDYKSPGEWRNKKAIVVGIGNSGADIAVELSRVTKQLYLSTRRGSWILDRLGYNGFPLDLFFNRVMTFLQSVLPFGVFCGLAERQLNQRFDHALYNLKPKHRLLDRRPLVNCDLPDQILQGALVMKPNLRAFRDSGVVFEDGTAEENIDAVVFCTGYKANFPFLPPGLSEGPDQELTLYKRLFPPSLSKPTLAVMGLFQTKGPIQPIMEMQARWAVRVFSGMSYLPSEKKMMEVIECDTKRNSKSYPCPRQAALYVDYISYLDFMAGEIGVRPNLLRLMLRDPVLWVKVAFGPCTPYQYRLTGPGQWAGARRAILTQWDRVAQPFRTRAVPEPESRSSVLFSPLLLVLGGTVITAVLMSKNETVPAQILDRCKIFLKDSWFTGYPQ